MEGFLLQRKGCGWVSCTRGRGGAGGSPALRGALHQGKGWGWRVPCTKGWEGVPCTKGRGGAGGSPALRGGKG